MRRAASTERVPPGRPASRWLASGLLLLGAVLVPLDAAERGEPPVQNIREPVHYAPSGVSLDQVISQVEKRHKARVVRVEQVHQNGRLVYKLRMLSEKEGRVWVVSVDAESGAEM